MVLVLFSHSLGFWDCRMSFSPTSFSLWTSPKAIFPGFQAGLDHKPCRYGWVSNKIIRAYFVNYFIANLTSPSGMQPCGAFHLGLCLLDFSSGPYLGNAQKSRLICFRKNLFRKEMHLGKTCSWKTHSTF